MGGTKFVWEVAQAPGRVAARSRLLVERASDYWRERYAEAGVPLHEIGGRTSTSMLYWLALPLYLRRDREAVVRETRQAAAIVSSFFPMHWAGNIAAGALGHQARPPLLRALPLLSRPRGQGGMYPAPKRALLAYLAAAYGRIDRKGVRASGPPAHPESRVRGHRSSASTAAAMPRPTYAGVDTRVLSSLLGPGARRPARAPRRRPDRDPLDRLLADQAHRPGAARVRGRTGPRPTAAPSCS